MLGERALTGDSFEKPPPPPEPARSRALKPLASSVRREAETEAILRALEQTHWNRKEAARLLDISYKTLLEKLRLYQIAKSNGHTA
jgi:two-component system response regulator AtoC